LIPATGMMHSAWACLTRFFIPYFLAAHVNHRPPQ
jgi:hypothetical protein